MNELDLMRRAKTYMDALAQGNDPISGCPVPPGDTLSQERLRRCFEYVSGVLNKLIVEQSAPRRDHTAALHAIISLADVAAGVSYTQEPVLLSRFWADLSKEQLVPQGLQSVNSSWLLPWLESKGIFTRRGPHGEPVATDQGRAFGLLIYPLKDEQRPQWTYSIAEPLQRMIVENLEEFILWDQDQWDRFLASSFPSPASAFSRKPVKIIELSRRLSAPADGVSLKKLTREMILRWLIQKGYMQRVDNAPGERGITRVPTPEGEALGIKLISSGRFSSVFYDTAVQHFIADHMPEIVDTARFFPVQSEDSPRQS